MKKLLAGVACLTIAAFSLQAVHSEDAAKKETEEVKLLCPVSGKPVQMDKFVAYKGGKVYLCCGGCPAVFKKDPAKYAVKANHQLVASGQYVETGCPISGGKLNPETAITLAGVKVAFWCNNCKGKVEGEKDADAQMELVFSDKAFEKGFKPKKSAKKKRQRGDD